MHMHTHTCTHTHSHTPTHAHTHTCTHPHMHTPTHTHTTHSSSELHFCIENRSKKTTVCTSDRLLIFVLVHADPNQWNTRITSYGERCCSCFIKSVATLFSSQSKPSKCALVTTSSIPFTKCCLLTPWEVLRLVSAEELCLVSVRMESITSSSTQLTFLLYWYCTS